MQVKENWTDKDFEVMNWHDSEIYSISFPRENLKLVMDIDYLFKWVLDETSNLFKFWVSPCTITFQNVLYLKIDFDFQNSIKLSIEVIERSNPRPYPLGKEIEWDYCIKTDKGIISFQTSGFIQYVKKQPTLNFSQVLSRE